LTKEWIVTKVTCQGSGGAIRQLVSVAVHNLIASLIKKKGTFSKNKSSNENSENAFPSSKWSHPW
jgi:hypothetical protein